MMDKLVIWDGLVGSYHLPIALEKEIVKVMISGKKKVITASIEIDPLSEYVLLRWK